MAELVDAPASGAGAGNGVEVRVLFRAPFSFKAGHQNVRPWIAIGKTAFRGWSWAGYTHIADGESELFYAVLHLQHDRKSARPQLCRLPPFEQQNPGILKIYFCAKLEITRLQCKFLAE